MDKKKKEEKDTSYSVMSEMETFVARKFLELDKPNQKKTFWALIGLTVLLMTASEIVSLLGLSQFFTVLIGAPAGVLLYAILFLELEVLRGKLTAFKEKHTFRARWGKLVFFWAVMIPLIIFTNVLSLQSLGGVIIVASFLASLSVFRKTAVEAYYIANGLIDPREVTYEEFEEEPEVKEEK